MSAAPVVQRIIPGAPPSIELSKSQKKKRKGAKGDDTQSPVVAESASSDKGHGHAETHESAPGLISRADSQAPQLAEDDQLLKPSPIVDLMNKRLKAMTKKIASPFPFPTNLDVLILLVITQARVSTYAATDVEKLNDDQVRSLKNLPTLEAIQKELAEVRKAIEVSQS